MTQLPAYLQNRQSRTLADSIAANVGMGSPPYVSIMGNRFTLIDATGEEVPVTTNANGIFYMDCVVIDNLEHESKIYYAKQYDPSATSWSPPDCWSDNGVAPSRNAGSPQSPTCGNCPKAVWGSATSRISGKGIPACAKYQKLALMIAGEEFPFLLRVPPNSLSNLRDYIQKFKGQPFDISDVITRVSFESGGVGTLVFNAVNVIDEATFQVREKFLANKQTDNLIGRGDLPRQGVLSPPQQEQPQQLVAPSAGAPAGTPFTGHPVQPSATLIPPNTPTQPGPATATTASPTEQPRRRRRSAATGDAPGTAGPAAPPQTAPFATPGVAGPGAAPNFGVAQPAGNVPAEVNAMLDSVFK